MESPLVRLCWKMSGTSELCDRIVAHPGLCSWELERQTVPQLSEDYKSLVTRLAIARTEQNRVTDTVKEIQVIIDDVRTVAQRLRDGCAKQNDDICQILGKALGYPWYKDDQQTFPGATEANGVCVGEHVAETIAMEAAKKIQQLQGQVERGR